MNEVISLDSSRTVWENFQLYCPILSYISYTAVQNMKLVGLG